MVESPDVYEPAETETVSDTVVRALADSRGVDPQNMDVRLYDAVDPDALDRLFSRGGTANTRVSFAVDDRRVVVDESRTVHVTTRTEPVTQSRTKNPQILRGAASPWRMVLPEL